MTDLATPTNQIPYWYWECPDPDCAFETSGQIVDNVERDRNLHIVVHDAWTRNSQPTAEPGN